MCNCGCEPIFSGFFDWEQIPLMLSCTLQHVLSLFLPHSHRKRGSQKHLSHCASTEQPERTHLGSGLRSGPILPKWLLKGQRTTQRLSKLHHGLSPDPVRPVQSNSHYCEVLFCHLGKGVKGMCKTGELPKRVSVQTETPLLTQRILKRHSVLHGDNHQC